MYKFEKIQFQDNISNFYPTQNWNLNNQTSKKKFNINFLRSHMRRPELEITFDNSDEVIKYQKLLRVPAFVIARKQEKFWRVTEKIFSEEL